MEHGHKWSVIQPFFPGRTDINIKNHWKRLDKEERRLSHPATHAGGDAFERFISSVMGKEDGAPGGPEGHDPFDFGMFW
jgi:hypothetical protein